MFIQTVILVIELVSICHIPVNADKCPKKMPISIEGECFRFQTDPLRFLDARDNCPKLEEGARLASIGSEDVLKTVEQLVFDFISSKLENAVFWLGMVMDDRSMSKPLKDRNWKWNFDDSVFVQKDYNLWETEGGPTKKGLSCGALNTSNDFLVKPVDCGGPRLPVLCMMKDGKTCKDDVAPYLTYGDYCIAAINAAMESYKMLGACEPNSPTPYREEMRKSVIMAAKNSFLGGGMYLNMMRIDGKFIDMNTGKEPEKDMWEEGEPRAEYDCVGLSLQPDNTLKLKTMNCGFLASSMCQIPMDRLQLDNPTSLSQNVLLSKFGAWENCGTCE